MGSPAFHQRFGDVRLLQSPEEIEKICERLPPLFLPFMAEQQPNSTDIYAFESERDAGGKVVVWNDHAVVADWASFEEFIHWLSDEESNGVPALL